MQFWNKESANNQNTYISEWVLPVLAAGRVVRILELLKVLVVPEFHKQREQHVQRLYHALIICTLVHGNVCHRANQPSIVSHMHVYVGSGELHFLQCTFHFLGPLLHQLIKFRHGFWVVHSGRGPRLVQILHSRDPPWNFFWFLVSVLDGINVHGRRSHHILRLDILKFQNCLVFAVEAGLVQNHNAQVFTSAIRFVHFQKWVNFTHSWHEIRYEGLYFGFKVNLLRFESLDVLKKLLDFTCDRQVSILHWIVGTLDLLVVVLGVIFFILAFLLLHLGLLLLLLLLNLLCLRRRFILACRLHRLGHIDLVSLFIWLDFFAVIYIDRKIIRLIINLGSL